MKLKLTAAALIAVLCLVFAAGCGKEEVSSSSAATEDSAAKYEYIVADAKLVCRTNINDFIKDNAVDMDSLAQSIGWEKTNNTGEWTAAADGARYLVTLSAVKDGVYPGVTIAKNTMDKKNSNTVINFIPAGKSELYAFDKGKLTMEDIAVLTYSMENASTSKNANPFTVLFAKYKNDKGEYVLTAK